MKSIPLILFLVPCFLIQGLNAQKKQKEVKYENIEWTNIWIPSAPKTDLPRVLLIGNSITQGYYNYVENSLKGKAYVARYTSSRGIVDPALFNEIKNLITHHKFDVIHFNNGLHGFEYTPVQYDDGLRKLIKLLKKHGQGATLIGVTSTRVMPGFSKWKTDDYNLKFIETRNEILIKACKENNIEVDDLFSVTNNHPEWFSGDKIHYNADGYKALGEQAVSLILKKLKN